MSEPAPWPESPEGGELGDGKYACATYRPSSEAELVQIVRDEARAGRAIYPRGGGTALDYGGVPRRPGVSVDVRALDQVVDYPHADMTITVQAGIVMSKLREILAEQRQRLLVDAPESDRATLGGVYATNTSGPRRFGAGRPRDQIIGVSFVTADGAVVKGGGRVVKNVAGYDFPKLLTGSMGTLGVLSQLTLKVRPIPQSSAVAWAAFSDLKAAAAALDSLNTSDSRPIAIELLNPSAARLLGSSLNLPTGDDKWVIAIGLEDNRASVLWQIDRLKVELGGADLTIRGEADSEPVWSGLIESQSFRPPGSIAITANLPPSAVAPLADALHWSRWAVQAHAGNGIVRAFLMVESELDAVARELDELRARTVRLGGNLVVARCPTDWKARLKVWGEPRSDWRLAERIKAALDPQAVMNPGRFVGII